MKEEQPATGKRYDGVRMSDCRESGTCFIERQGSVDVDGPGVNLSDQVRHLNRVVLRAQQEWSVFAHILFGVPGDSRRGRLWRSAHIDDRIAYPDGGHSVELSAANVA